MSQVQEQREDNHEITLSGKESDVPFPKQPREDKKYGGAYTYESKFKAAW